MRLELRDDPPLKTKCRSLRHHDATNALVGARALEWIEHGEVCRTASFSQSP